MVDIKYANAYKEVLEILKYIPKKDYNKIPKSKIELFERNANDEYIFSYDPNKTFGEQEISKTAKGIISILYRDYFANEKEREEILIKQHDIRTKIEEEKRQKYNPNVFKDKNNFNKEKNNVIDLEIANYKESLISKFINKIKKLLKK